LPKHGIISGPVVVLLALILAACTHQDPPRVPPPPHRVTIQKSPCGGELKVDMTDDPGVGRRVDLVTLTGSGLSWNITTTGSDSLAGGSSTNTPTYLTPYQVIIPSGTLIGVGGPGCTT
jgi:hypothetical protein